MTLTKPNTKTIGEVTMDARSKYFIEDETNWYNGLLTDVGLDHKVSIVPKIYADDYEVYVHEMGNPKLEYFTDFEQALKYCKIRFKDAEWSNLG